MSNNYKVGDIIRFGYVPPYHYAVYIGDGEIVHYNRVDGKVSIIREKITEYEERKGKTYKKTVVTYKSLGDKSPLDVIIERAFRYVGEGEYNLLVKNCEHFATWVVYGSDISGQTRAVAVVGGTGGTTVAGTVTGAVTGAVTGVIVGTIVPVIGNIFGAGVGAAIGAGIGSGLGFISSSIAIGISFLKRKKKKANFLTSKQ
jgi:hypothetical protein